MMDFACFLFCYAIVAGATTIFELGAAATTTSTTIPTISRIAFLHHPSPKNSEGLSRIQSTTAFTRRARSNTRFVRTNISSSSHAVTARRWATATTHPDSDSESGTSDNNKDILDDALLQTTFPSENDNVNDNDAESEDVSRLRSITFVGVREEPGLLCDFLMEIGACSTAITDYDKGTDQEQPRYGEPGVTMSGAIPTTTAYDPFQIHQRSQDQVNSQESKLLEILPVWDRCNVTAHFPASIDLNFVLELVSDAFEDPALAYQKPQQSQSQGQAGESANSETMATAAVVSEIPDRDWIVHVQQSWKPILVAKDQLVLKFPWHTNEDVQQVLQNAKAFDDNNVNQNDEIIQIQLQGGIAFGTGEHPTTQLCLEWIMEQVSNELQQRQQDDGDDEELVILDYGAGSGVLGLAACALGKQQQQSKRRSSMMCDDNNGNEDAGVNSIVKAIGIDIDYDACRICNMNAKINDLNMKCYLPNMNHYRTKTKGDESKDEGLKLQQQGQDDESDSVLFKAAQRATTTSASASASTDSDNGDDENDIFLPDNLDTKQYKYVVANILAAPLIVLAPSLVQRMASDGGQIGMSGILKHQAQDIIQAYTEAGLSNVRIEQECDGWVLVTGTKQTKDK